MDIAPVTEADPGRSDAARRTSGVRRRKKHGAVSGDRIDSPAVREAIPDAKAWSFRRVIAGATTGLLLIAAGGRGLHVATRMRPGGEGRPFPLETYRRELGGEHVQFGSIYTDTRCAELLGRLVTENREANFQKYIADQVLHRDTADAKPPLEISCGSDSEAFSAATGAVPFGVYRDDQHDITLSTDMHRHPRLYDDRGQVSGWDRVLAHELEHARQAVLHPSAAVFAQHVPDRQYFTVEERRAVAASDGTRAVEHGWERPRLANFDPASGSAGEQRAYYDRILDADDRLPAETYLGIRHAALQQDQDANVVRQSLRMRAGPLAHGTETELVAHIVKANRLMLASLAGKSSPQAARKLDARTRELMRKVQLEDAGATMHGCKFLTREHRDGQDWLAYQVVSGLDHAADIQTPTFSSPTLRFYTGLYRVK